MRIHLAALLTLPLLLSACPDKPAPGEPAAKAAAEPAKAATEPAKATAEPTKAAAEPTKAAAPPAEIKPIDLGPLKAGPLAEVVERLNTAHYDAEALGLQSVEGRVEMTSKKMGVLARAKVKWTSASTPVVTLVEVEKGGKKIPAPVGDTPNQIGAAIGWSDLQFKILKLVEGLGNGYLAHRLLEWKESKGEVALDGQTLRLTLQQGEQGTVTVEVGERYEVRKVTATHPKGFTRAMTYEMQTHQGRNLVTGAVLEAKTAKGAKLHKRASMMLKAIHGTRVEIGYGEAGRFFLPVKLRKLVPSMAEELTMAITYDKVTP